MSVVLRLADPERDAAGCRAIYAPHVAGAASFEEEVPSEPEMARRIAAAHRWLVAEVRGETAGYAYAGEHRARAAYRWSADVSVYVAPAQQGHGIGRALYVALLGELRERGFRSAVAGITLPNEPSVGLHEALGFAPVGVYRGVGWKAGAWRDVGWWQLDLGAPAGVPPPDPR